MFALAASLLLDSTPAVLAAGASYAVIFVGLGLLSPAASELLNEQAEATERATVISLDSLVLQAAGVIGNLTLMRLAASTGPGPAWCLAGGILVAGTIALLAVGRRTAVPAPDRTEAPVPVP